MKKIFTGDFRLEEDRNAIKSMYYPDTPSDGEMTLKVEQLKLESIGQLVDAVIESEDDDDVRVFLENTCGAFFSHKESQHVNFVRLEFRDGQLFPSFIHRTEDEKISLARSNKGNIDGLSLSELKDIIDIDYTVYKITKQ